MKAYKVNMLCHPSIGGEDRLVSFTIQSRDAMQALGLWKMTFGDKWVRIKVTSITEVK